MVVTTDFHVSKTCFSREIFFAEILFLYLISETAGRNKSVMDVKTDIHVSTRYFAENIVINKYFPGLWAKCFWLFAKKKFAVLSILPSTSSEDLFGEKQNC